MEAPPSPSIMPTIEKNVILAPFTTYKIGGPADLFAKAESTQELIDLVKMAKAKKWPFFILGLGANVLVGDKGFRGLVILNRAQKATFRSDLLTAESGAKISQLLESAKERGLSGLEHFAGIPSTVGGALRQNLHFLSPDRTGTIFIESILKSAKILDEKDKVEMVDKSFFKFGYDDSILHHRQIVLLEATFKLTFKPKAEIEKQIEANLAWRRAKQPQLEEFPSCGSVFKKIEGVGAGRLVDKVGLKGRRIGDAQISKKHANYIVNLGNAKASDVLALINLAQKEVSEKLGYLLLPEVGLVGEF